MSLNKKYLLLGFIILQFVLLSTLLIALKRQQEIRSRAAQEINQEQQLNEAGIADAETKIGENSLDSIRSEIQTQTSKPELQVSGISNNPRIKKEVYGFLWYPYVDSDSDKAESYLQYPYLTTLAYAGLVLNKEGNINKNNTPYNVWQSQRLKKILTDAKAEGVKIHPRIATFESNNVNFLLETSERRQKAVLSIIEEIKNAPVAVDGVNIDFEPVPTQSRDEFSDFIKKLRTEMDKLNPDLEIVIDTFSSTAVAEGGFDLEELTPYVDGFFVMSFTLINQDLAEKAGSLNHFKSLEKVAENYLNKVPSDKIILGFPFYTSKWNTQDDSFRSINVKGNNDLIFYKDAYAEAKVYGGKYNETQKTAWYSYYECGMHAGWKQVYFDNEQALIEKFKIANSKNLKGVGFWTFNQNKSLDIWSAIYNSFADKRLIGPPSLKPGATPQYFIPDPNCKAPVTPTKTPTPTPTNKPISTPIPTSLPGATILKFNSIKLHGVGKGGDNSNPNSTGNLNPLRTTRTITVEILDGSDNIVTTATGNIVYKSATGDFSGEVSLNSSIPSIDYSVKIKSPQFLKRSLGISKINTGVVNNMPNAILITGDIDNDNKLTNLDYNILADCYADLTNPKNCSNVNKKLTADLSDDGKVNLVDYNTFIRELSIVEGD